MDIIESLCVAYPDSFEKLDIASNPNYVFLNDKNFNTRQLFDAEGSTVFVNSFIECEHYVSGGWDFTPVKNLELDLHNFLLVGVVVTILVQFLIKKFKVFSKE